VLKKLSIFLNFTETEIKVLLFLLSAFILGFGYKTLFQNNGNDTKKTFDYSREDSIFFSIGNEIDSTEAYIEEDKFVDYKQEVLDFNESDFTDSNANQTLEEKSININSAELKELIMLPGIGEKTAERIIDLREKRSGFKTLRELLEVKGIGETKFNNIEKYLFIE
jgi:competence ComEA-like helix-hairpin-helix protein